MKAILLRYLWGIVAVGIYLLLVGALLVYFNYRSNETKRHYVKKDEHRIQVGLSVPSKKRERKKSAQNKPKRHDLSAANPPKKTVPKRTIRKHVSKKKHLDKPERKTVSKRQKIRKKVVKKQVAKQKRHSKVIPKSKPKDLFKNVKTEKKPLIKVTDKPIKSKSRKPIFEMKEKAVSASERIRESLKEQKNMDSGVEDVYLAHVQEMLEGWPAQSDFAGEKVRVHLKIDPTGHFTFVIKRKSNNPEFNRALTEYLEQLQVFGFGPHKGSRTYLFEAEFIAKE